LIGNSEHTDLSVSKTVKTLRNGLGHHVQFPKLVRFQHDAETKQCYRSMGYDSMPYFDSSKISGCLQTKEL